MPPGSQSWPVMRTLAGCLYGTEYPADRTSVCNVHWEDSALLCLLCLDLASAGHTEPVLRRFSLTVVVASAIQCNGFRHLDPCMRNLWSTRGKSDPFNGSRNDCAQINTTVLS